METIRELVSADGAVWSYIEFEGEHFLQHRWDVDAEGPVATIPLPRDVLVFLAAAVSVKTASVVAFPKLRAVV